MFHLVLESHDGRAPGADSEEKHEPVSDIDTVVVDSLKALDPEWPIREAVVARSSFFITKSPVRYSISSKPPLTHSPQQLEPCTPALGNAIRVLALILSPAA